MSISDDDITNSPRRRSAAKVAVIPTARQRDSDGDGGDSDAPSGDSDAPTAATPTAPTAALTARLLSADAHGRSGASHTRTPLTSPNWSAIRPRSGAGSCSVGRCVAGGGVERSATRRVVERLFAAARGSRPSASCAPAAPCRTPGHPAGGDRQSRRRVVPPTRYRSIRGATRWCSKGCITRTAPGQARHNLALASTTRCRSMPTSHRRVLAAWTCTSTSTTCSSSSSGFQAVAHLDAARAPPPIRSGPAFDRCATIRRARRSAARHHDGRWRLLYLPRGIRMPRSGGSAVGAPHHRVGAVSGRSTPSRDDGESPPAG